jgi:hypothetical protein
MNVSRPLLRLVSTCDQPSPKHGLADFMKCAGVAPYAFTYRMLEPTQPDGPVEIKLTFRTSPEAATFAEGLLRLRDIYLGALTNRKESADS